MTMKRTCLDCGAEIPGDGSAGGCVACLLRIGLERTGDQSEKAGDQIEGKPGKLWQIGERIEGRWEILQILGGGMGRVYIVLDHNGAGPQEVCTYDPNAADLGRSRTQQISIPPTRVAIKTYRDEIFERNPQVSALFQKEALLWVNLERHKNVARALGVKLLGGKPHLFLEYVAGGDLGARIPALASARDLPRVVGIALQFCDGMIHILSQGIKVHRDIKPANCLLAEDGTLKVTDFGLAKVVDDAALTEPGVIDGRSLSGVRTPTGQLAGTPAYMAPEQFEDAKRVDVRSDIYSFGIMVYQMVTGRLPFMPLGGGSSQQFKRLHQEEPPPPLNSELADLNEIVRVCLAKNPAQRFTSFSVIRRLLADLVHKLPNSSQQRSATTCEPKIIDFGQFKLVPEEMVPAGENPLQLVSKGLSLRALGRHAEAVSLFDRVVTQFPWCAEAWSAKGSVLEDQGRFLDAVAFFERALEIYERDPVRADSATRISQEWSNKGIVCT